MGDSRWCRRNGGRRCAAQRRAGRYVRLTGFLRAAEFRLMVDSKAAGRTKSRGALLSAALSVRGNAHDHRDF